MSTGIVIIGRNEGARLEACFKSTVCEGRPVVYVDSGSTDGSVGLARSLGAQCVELDMTRPFSQSRARNAGFARLLQVAPDIELVQFVDGDCEVISGWLERGEQAMREHGEAGIVCGRVMERNPEASVYNRLCSLEWQKPAGEITACGGIFMIRAAVFHKAEGFREDVLAAEDDELCLRIRRQGWKVLSIDAPMVHHDAAMFHFRQWWRRAMRTGYAFAQGAFLHGSSDEKHFVRDCQRVLIWGVALPLVAAALAPWTEGLSLLLMLGYGLLGGRIFVYGRRRGWPWRHAAIYAFFTVLAKWPNLIGMVRFHRDQMMGRQIQLIEYKNLERQT